jgi:hypothetical protein
VRAILVTLSACTALLGTAASARAQGNTAQAQFDYGLAEMEAGRYASGCPALAESYRIDPHPGVLFTLAECENKGGKIASALTHYEAYLDLFERMSDEQKAHQRGRDKVSREQRERLRAQVPQLAVSLPGSAPPGTTVMRDGELLGAPSLGAPLPVDPGEHVLVARTPDGAAHETRVVVEAGQRKEVVAELTGPPPGVVPATGAAPPPAPARAPETVSAPTSPVRPWAWVAASVGLAGIAVGGVAGALVLGDKSTIDANCHPDHTCNATGLDASSHANTFGLVSDVAFAVGAAGVATAAFLFLWPQARTWHAVAQPQPHGGFVGLHATW